MESALEKADKALRFNPWKPDGLAVRGYTLFCQARLRREHGSVTRVPQVRDPLFFSQAIAQWAGIFPCNSTTIFSFNPRTSNWAIPLAIPLSCLVQPSQATMQSKIKLMRSQLANGYRTRAFNINWETGCNKDNKNKNKRKNKHIWPPRSHLNCHPRPQRNLTLNLFKLSPPPSSALRWWLGLLLLPAGSGPKLHFDLIFDG